jgi:DNA-directed RNA polymerase specialized sigma24 family protein
MSDEDRITRLETKIDTVIRLLALQLLTKEQTVRERALMLNKAGLSSREIAGLCDTTPNTISVAISQAKKESKG